MLRRLRFTGLDMVMGPMWRSRIRCSLEVVLSLQ